MTRPLISDELWKMIEPALPPHNPRFWGGRPPLDDRRALAGIIFVLKTGIPWEYLPQEMGCGSGMTCWRRLREWQEAGVWQRLHELLLAKLNQADRIDWSRAAIDSSHVRAAYELAWWRVGGSRACRCGFGFVNALLGAGFPRQSL